MLDFFREKRPSENFLLVADTHNQLQNNDDLEKFVNIIGIPGSAHQKYQHILLLGDISVNDIECIRKLLPKLFEKGEVYGIYGNHDAKKTFNWFGIHDLHGRMARVSGIKIAGWEGSSKYKNERFPSMLQNESIQYAKNISICGEFPDLLISHDKPRTDWVKEEHALEILEHHVGLAGIYEYMKIADIPVNIHGHYHTNYAKQLPNGSEEICIFPFACLRIWKDRAFRIYDMNGKEIQ